MRAPSLFFGAVLCLTASLQVSSFTQNADLLLLTLNHHSSARTGPAESARISADANVSAGIFLQKLDHFSKVSHTFIQRYVVNTRYANGAGNILIVGDSAPIDAAVVADEAYAHVQLAQAIGATIWLLEHRFYGESLPHKDLSAESLTYLNTKQAVEDVAEFVRGKSDGNSAKWLVYGSGVAGAIALHFRIAYPNLSAGVVASSPPAVPSPDFYLFQRNVEQSYAEYSGECYEKLAAMVADVRNALQSEAGRARLSAALGLRPPLNSLHLTDSQLQLINVLIAQMFQRPVVYNKVNTGQYSVRNGGVADVCAMLDALSFGADSIGAFAALSVALLPAGAGSLVAGIPIAYGDYITALSNSTYDAGSPWRATARAFLWQQCNEFGFFTTTDYGGLIFGSGVPNNFWINVCEDTFGEAYDVDHLKYVIKNSGSYLGRTDVYQGTNAIITVGGGDPWRSVGFSGASKPSSAVLQIPGVGHSADFHRSNPQDGEAVREARRVIAVTAAKWINGNGHSRVSKLRQKMHAKNAPKRRHRRQQRTIHSWAAELHFEGAGQVRNRVATQPSYEQTARNRQIRRHLERRYNLHANERLRRLGEIQAANAPAGRDDDGGDVRHGYIVQDLDHFDPTVNRKWKQYFYINEEFVKPDKELVFLMIGGEGPIDSRDVGTLFNMGLWGKKHGALLLSLEHRFYGESVPTKEGSDAPDYSTPTLEWLTSEQALADAAVFIRAVNAARKFREPRWIIFGGSYPGNLAAWFRLKYPDLVIAAVSSSAPVQAKADFFEYHQVANNASRWLVAPGCGSEVHSFLGWLNDKLTTRRGRRDINKIFNICNNAWDADYISELEVQYFVSTFVYTISGTVQYDDPGHSRLQKACDFFADANRDLRETGTISRARLVQLLGPSCVDVSYDSVLQYFSDETTDAQMRCWVWQTCNEFGYYQTTNMGHNIFESAMPINMDLQLCQDVYGEKFTRDYIEERIRLTNEFYGGQDGYNGTNVVFANGSEDPWHALGVCDGHTPANGGAGVTSLLIDGTSHCLDMFQPRPNDTPGLSEAKQHIGAIVDHWVRK